MSLHVYFLRHGQTVLSREDSFCGSGLDPELTADGAQMAHAFAHTYGSQAWSAIFSSPLRRTMQTAQPVCELLGMNAEVRDQLREIGYGKWEGLTKEKVATEFHDDYVSWLADPEWHVPTGGESAASDLRFSHADKW